MGNSAVGWAIVASIVVHAGLWLVPVPDSRAAADRPDKPAPPVMRTDLWAGQTFEAPELLGPGAPDPGPGRGSGEAVARTEPSPAPTPRPHPPPKPPTAPPPGAAPAAAGSSAGGSGIGVGTYGAEGTTDGARDLVRSFVRAMPPAVSADPIWLLLPLGPAASADVKLAVDGDGKVSLIEPAADKPPIPPLVSTIIRRTLVLLASGRFALDPSHATAGAESVHISVVVTQQDPPSERELSAGGAFGLGSDAPTDARPGRAYFTLGSGRHVDVTVQRLLPRR
jgi:hypothetical protein